jgi:hypothetical protein
MTAAIRRLVEPFHPLFAGPGGALLPAPFQRLAHGPPQNVATYATFHSLGEAFLHRLVLSGNTHVTMRNSVNNDQ